MISLAAKNLALFLLEEGKEIAARKAIVQARRMGRPPSDDEFAAARKYFSDARE